MQNKYFTTPIYYVNDKPHIGHAYTSLAVDILKRFYISRGIDSFFLTGTDEHGQKVEKAAIDQGIDPLKFTNGVSQNFRDLSDLLNLSNDDFIRTTEERHKISAQNLWKVLLEKDEIYLSKYSGWYSVRDEAFVAENEIVEKDGKKYNGFGSELSWVEEESYFFRLSKWQDKLLKFYKENTDFIVPKSRANEVIKFVESGLKDLSVSRTTFKWGIGVPNNKNHIIYVWLDALTNYISALGYPETEAELYKKYWPGIHVVGKDIIRFHAIFWPAFLMAADLSPPKQIVAHGWWTNEGQKISKSLGNVIDPNELINVYGLDSIRYFLFREVPFGNDGDFSKLAIKNRINGELANNYGNLIQRILSFIYKNLDQNIELTVENYDFDILKQINESEAELFKFIENYKFDEYLKKLFLFMNDLNNYVDKTAPWALKKTDPEEMKRVLANISLCIIRVTQYLSPFIPLKSKEVFKLFDNLDDIDLFHFDNFEKIKSLNHFKINKPEPLFTKIE